MTSVSSSDKASPSDVEDEKAAVMSLLGLQSRGQENGAPAHKKQKAETDVSSDRQGDTTQDSVRETFRQALSPPAKPEVDPSTSSYEVEIGKKQSSHPTISGQFDDATEEETGGLSSVPTSKPEGTQDTGVPPPPGLRQQISQEHPVPPPPHLIQQTSQELVSPSASSHQRSPQDLVRIAALAAIQRSGMLEAGNPYGRALQVPYAATADYLEQERYIQAVMQLQAAQRQVANQLPLDGSPPAVGSMNHFAQAPQLPIPIAPSNFASELSSGPLSHDPNARGHLTDIAGSKRAANGAIVGKKSTRHPGNNFNDSDSYKMRKAVEIPTMKPPTNVENKVHRVESEDEIEEEASDEDNANSVEEANRPKSKSARIFSTKIRYEQYTPPSSWADLTRVRKMPPTKADRNQENPIREVGEHDVLLGRGGLTNTNPGNIRFRALVSKYRMHYCTAPKGDKGALARYLCNFVRAHHGRFLQKHSKSQHWHEVGDDKAVMKCGQALREGTAELIRKVLDPSEAQEGEALQGAQE